MKFSSFHALLGLIGLQAVACSKAEELNEPGIEVFEIVGYDESEIQRFEIPKRFHFSSHASFPMEGTRVHSADGEPSLRNQNWAVSKIDAVTEEPTVWRLVFSTGYTSIRAEVKPIDDGYVGTYTWSSCTVRPGEEFPIQLRKV
ncbi:MAG: hypothetical protein HQ519_13370 [Planctomycetes bacterium]|nr:hypothetical protein [Planctomycetota bacterium]